MAQRVELLYFLGKWSLITHQYTTALHYLDNAFQNCLCEAYHNRRSILNLLIPLKILHGTLPSQSLMDEFELSHYNDLCKAIRCGNLALFQAHMDKFWMYYLSVGVIDMILILKQLVMVQFLRKCFKCYAKINPMGSLRMKWPLIEAAARLDGSIDAISDLEIEISRLIEKRLVVGVITPGVGLSLSGQIASPFPKVGLLSDDEEHKNVLEYVLFNEFQM